MKKAVAQHIRDQILSGASRPGDRVDQDAIAAELGLSRLPVREALITLDAEGLIDNIPRRGAFVAALKPDDIRDHFEMYGLLSGLAAARVAGDPPPGLIAQLDEINEAMRSATDPGDHDGLNFRFHQIINQAGSSRRLRTVLRMLARNMPTNFFASNTEWEWKERAISEHALIVAALRAEDGTSAAQSMAAHFRHTGAQAVHLLEASGFWDAREQDQER